MPFEAGNEDWKKGVGKQANRRLLTSAIERELLQFEDSKIGVKQGEASRKIARKVVEMALDGDKWAVEFIADRTEGKATQNVNQKHEHRIAESITEEHARLVAQGFLDSLRTNPGDSAQEPDRLHDGLSP
jgi:isocitrate dehydrogenase